MPWKDSKVRNAREKERRDTRREEWLRENGPCAQCSSWDDLEVDHINPEDKTSHRIWLWSETRRLSELAKCQALCKRCHKEKTAAYRESPHGTNSRYTSPKWRCRCQPCKDAHTAVNNQYK